MLVKFLLYAAESSSGMMNNTKPEITKLAYAT